MWSPPYLNYHLASLGLDIVHPFSTNEVNKHLDGKYQLKSESTGVLIGHTKSIWPHFIQWLKRDHSRVELENPFDRYVEDCIDPLEPRIYSHQGKPFYYPFIKLGVATNLCASTKAHLALHPRFGPWFGLRAVIVIDGIYEEEVQELHLPENVIEKCNNIGAAFDFNSTDYRDFISLRSSCPLGQDYRYGQDQLNYHYTKNKTILRDSL
jgi:hypothetical protein